MHLEEKYNIARGKLENARQAFENIQKEAYYQKQAELQIKRNRLEEERAKNRNLVMDAFNSWRHESDERLQMLLAEQNRADNALKELRQWHPMANEIKQVDEGLQQLNFTEKENAARQTAVKSQIAQITAEYEMKESEMKQTSQREQERLDADRTQMREQIAKIDGLLARLDGSFYKWLCENKEGWENTIGKVVDEERILYAQGLDPQLDIVANGMFGVKLNLDNVASVHRTPDEYRLEKNNLEEQVRQINRQLTQLPVTLQEEIAKLSKKYIIQIKPLRQGMTSLKVEEEQVPAKRQNLQNHRHQLEMEEQERIAQEKEIRERLFNEALLKVQSEKDAREKSELKYKKDLKELDLSFNKAIKALDEELRIFKEAQQSEAERRDKEFAAQKKQLDEQQKAELAGKGVDTGLLEQYRRALEGLMEQLKRIDRERPIVIRYRDAEKTFSPGNRKSKRQSRLLSSGCSCCASVMKTGGHVSGKSVKRWKSVRKHFSRN